MDVAIEKQRHLSSPKQKSPNNNAKKNRQPVTRIDTQKTPAQAELRGTIQVLGNYGISWDYIVVNGITW
jgi:hypothetical protein